MKPTLKLSVTIEKVENGFILTTADKTYIAERMYQLENLITEVIKSVEEKLSEAPDA